MKFFSITRSLILTVSTFVSTPNSADYPYILTVASSPKPEFHAALTFAPMFFINTAGRWNDCHVRTRPRAVQRRSIGAPAERHQHHKSVRGEVKFCYMNKAKLSLSLTLSQRSFYIAYNPYTHQ